MAVVSVVGTFRSGKSTLLNWLSGERAGDGGCFEVGTEPGAKTQGLWILLETLKGKTRDGRDVNIVLVDVEGFDDPNKDGNNQNVTLYLLASLTSSHMILNCKEKLDYQVMEKLGLV